MDIVNNSFSDGEYEWSASDYTTLKIQYASLC